MTQGMISGLVDIANHIKLSVRPTKRIPGGELTVRGWRNQRQFSFRSPENAAMHFFLHLKACSHCPEDHSWKGAAIVQHYTICRLCGIETIIVGKTDELVCIIEVTLRMLTGSVSGFNENPGSTKRY